MKKVVYYFKAVGNDSLDRAEKSAIKIHKIMNLFNMPYNYSFAGSPEGYYWVICREKFLDECLHEIQFNNFKKRAELEGYVFINFDEVNIEKFNYPLRVKVSDVSEKHAKEQKRTFTAVGEFIDLTDNITYYIIRSHNTHTSWKYIVPVEELKVTKKEIAKKFNVEPECLEIID